MEVSDGNVKRLKLGPSFVHKQVLSPKVKKCLVFISILLCFCEVFAGATNYAGEKAVSISLNEKESYSVRAVNHPNSELEVSYHVVSASSHCRQQNGPGFVGFSAPGQSSSCKKLANTFERSGQVFCKQYLTHIYPSHNFW